MTSTTTPSLVESSLERCQLMFWGRDLEFNFFSPLRGTNSYITYISPIIFFRFLALKGTVTATAVELLRQNTLRGCTWEVPPPCPLWSGLAWPVIAIHRRNVTSERKRGEKDCTLDVFQRTSLFYTELNLASQLLNELCNSFFFFIKIELRKDIFQNLAFY